MHTVYLKFCLIDVFPAMTGNFISLHLCSVCW